MAPTFLLAGELGSGKRTLARHLAKRFGYSLLSINGWELPGGDLHPFFHLNCQLIRRFRYRFVQLKKSCRRVKYHLESKSLRRILIFQED